MIMITNNDIYNMNAIWAPGPGDSTWKGGNLAGTPDLTHPATIVPGNSNTREREREIYIYVCMCLYMHIHRYTYIYVHEHVYIYMYMYV